MTSVPVARNSAMSCRHSAQPSLARACGLRIHDQRAAELDDQPARRTNGGQGRLCSALGEARAHAVTVVVAAAARSRRASCTIVISTRRISGTPSPLTPEAT